MGKGGGRRREDDEDDRGCGWWERRRKVQGEEETSEEPGNARVGEEKGGEAFFFPFAANSGRALGLFVLISLFSVLFLVLLSASVILN